MTLVVIWNTLKGHTYQGINSQQIQFAGDI